MLYSWVWIILWYLCSAISIIHLYAMIWKYIYLELVFDCSIVVGTWSLFVRPSPFAQASTWNRLTVYSVCY
jgi:hypothetical protein